MRRVITPQRMNTLKTECRAHTHNLIVINRHNLIIVSGFASWVKPKGPSDDDSNQSGSTILINPALPMSKMVLGLAEATHRIAAFPWIATINVSPNGSIFPPNYTSCRIGPKYGDFSQSRLGLPCDCECLSLDALRASDGRTKAIALDRPDHATCHPFPGHFGQR